MIKRCVNCLWYIHAVQRFFKMTKINDRIVDWGLSSLLPSSLVKVILNGTNIIFNFYNFIIFQNGAQFWKYNNFVNYVILWILFSVGIFILHIYILQWCNVLIILIIILIFWTNYTFKYMFGVKHYLQKKVFIILDN